MKISRLLLTTICMMICLLFPAQVKAEEVIMGFDERGRAYGARRSVPVAINVYAKDGTVPQVIHEGGAFKGCEYDVLRVDPSEDTFLAVDYAGPSLLNYLYDSNLTENGYHRVGGINASYYSGDGCPVGAIRRYNEWSYCNGMELSPSFGNGYATMYFNNTKMVTKYHGWINEGWYPYGDGIWIAETNGIHAYGIDSKYAISGSYTFFADGIEQDITGGVSGKHTTRAATVFAQRADKQYLLLTFFGNITDESIKEFLRKENVTDAIRFDSGGSTQMIYESTLVNLPYLKSDYSEIVDDTPLFGWDAVARGYPAIPEDKRRNIHIDLSNTDIQLYSGSIKEGTSLKVIDQEGNVILDRENIQHDMHITAVPTSSQIKIESSNDNIFYYDRSMYGKIREVWKSGNSNCLVLLAFFEDIPSTAEYFMINIYSENDQIWSSWSAVPVSVTIQDSEGTVKETYTLDTDGNIETKPEEIDGYIFERWEVSGTVTDIRLKPIYRQKTFLEKVLGKILDFANMIW